MEYINQTTLVLDEIRLRAIAEALAPGKEVEVMIVGAGTMRAINKRERGKDKVTDVLSFPIEDPTGKHLGSLILCREKITELSMQLGHTVDEEAALLSVHGLLHLLGYDHETDKGEMRALEIAWIEKLGLPESLAVRTGNL